MEGVHAQKSFNMATDMVSVTDLAYFLNLASVLADSKLETIRKYPPVKLFYNHPRPKSPHTGTELNNESSNTSII